jgi:glycosyltransferase involved in cell wall biosynthesis
VALLFLLNSLTASGGSERKSVRVVNELARRGHQVHLVYLNPPDTLRDQVRKDVRVFHLARKGKFDLTALLKLRKYVKQNAVKTVMCVNLYPILYGAILEMILPRGQIAGVYFLNTSSFESARDRLKMVIYRPLLRRGARLIFGCQKQQDEWVAHYRLDPGRCSYIHNGVDCEFFDPATATEMGKELRKQLGSAPDDFVIVSVGQFRPEKKQEDLISACAELVRAGYPVHLALVGDGPRRANLLRHVEVTGMSERVHLLGPLADVRPALGAADVFVLSSVAVETFSNAALEAMAAGLPVVLSDIGGASEMVIDGYNGYLYPPGDVSVLTKKIAFFLDNRGPRKQIGEQARTIVRQKFGFDAMVNEYQKLVTG